MVEHIVLFKLKADSPPDKQQALLEALVGLRDHIPGILHASAGANFSARAQGYTHGFLVRFTDRAALAHYLTHPAHVAVVEKFVRPISESVLVVDFEASP